MLSAESLDVSGMTHRLQQSLTADVNRPCLVVGGVCYDHLLPSFGDAGTVAEAPDNTGGLSCCDDRQSSDQRSCRPGWCTAAGQGQRPMYSQKPSHSTASQ